MLELDRRLIAVTPSERQIALQKLEMYAFVHFTVNTFTDKEWGDGTENPEIFNPEKLDAHQWVSALKAAGMKGLILTCKHHDGFCLWPSRYTEHSVASSAYKGGKGDVVKEVADACHAEGLAFGVYLSPWDRNNALYGTGKEYDDYFVHQLHELLTQYGEVFSVWFDGACGEGPNGKKQYYDWERYYAAIRELQPGACIHVCGPDIRWCGNEAGDTRESEWSVVPSRTMDTEKVASASQQADNEEFRQRKINAQDRDLGSRAILENEMELTWYPAEVNTSIRPGWFWHAHENDKVRPLEELIHIYEHSVGGNATFLLNIPPTNEGLFHEADVQRLKEFGAYLADAYGTNLLPDARLTASEAAQGHEIACVIADDESCYIPAQEGEGAQICVRWSEEKTFRRIVLKENIRMSQRVEAFCVDVEENGEWKQIYAGTIIGHKKIVTLPATTASALRIRITDARVAPTVAFLGVYA